MQMHPIILTKQQYPLYDAFAYSHPYSSIHQTTKWAHFQSNIPSRDKFWVIALVDAPAHDTPAHDAPVKADAKPKSQVKPSANHILAGTILIKHRLPNNKHCWLYSPRGPLLDYNNPTKAEAQLEALTQKIRQIAKEENAIFYRIDPPIPATTHNKTALLPKLKKLHFHPTHLGFQPQDTLLLDLAKTPEEILAQMKPKGRYNIRLAEKKGVKIVEADPTQPNAKGQNLFAKNLAAYYKILQETLSRDKFYGHGIGFYKNMIECLAAPDLSPGLAAPGLSPGHKSAIKAPSAKLYLAYHGETPIAGIIVTFYKDTAIYYYGASSNEHRNLMAPYLLQWHAINQAKQYGCKTYDFLGIAPPKPKTMLSPQENPMGPPSHPWRGVTEFKRKFGGTHVKYLPAQELTFKPLIHFIYKLAKTLRKLFR